MALVNKDVVASELAVSRFAIRDWVRLGYIPHVRIGRLVRFDLDEVRGWASKQRREGRDRLAPKVEVPT